MEDQQQFVLVRISIAEVNGQKALKVPPSDTISSVKFQIIDKLTGVNIENILNYGLWLPGSDGKEGKFLDEQRSVKDYRLSETVSTTFKPIYVTMKGVKG